MVCKTVDLYDYFKMKKPNGANGILRAYVHLQSQEFCVGRKRPAMLVLPGGAYVSCSDREKEPIALAFVAKGYNAFTLEYSVAPLKFPTALIEAAMAMVYVRENAEEYYIMPDKVAAIGFSAGGHLLGTLITMFDCDEVKSALKEKSSLARPDAALFAYPVITSGELTHSDSMQNLCGNDETLRERVSVEKHINKDTTPAFIWTLAADRDVSPENSLMLASSYAKTGAPYELHVFGGGTHGMSLSNLETAFRTREDLIDPYVEIWTNLAEKWLVKQDFKIKID